MYSLFSRFPNPSKMPRQTPAFMAPEIRISEKRLNLFSYLGAKKLILDHMFNLLFRRTGAQLFNLFLVQGFVHWAWCTGPFKYRPSPRLSAGVVRTCEAWGEAGEMVHGLFSPWSAEMLPCWIYGRFFYHIKHLHPNTELMTSFSMLPLLFLYIQ